MNSFINLHTNTEYSILESLIKIDALINFAKDNNLDTLIITDHNNMFGVAEFLEKAKANNIKPIVGLDLDVDDFRLILIAKNYQGYLHLIWLSSKKMSGDNISLNEINTDNIIVIDHPRLGYYCKYNSYPKINNYYRGLKEGYDIYGVAVFETRVLYPNQNNTLSILHNIKTGKKVLSDNDYSFILKPNIDYRMISAAKIISDSCNIVFPDVINHIPKFNLEIDSDILIKNILKKSLKTLFQNNALLKKDIYINRCKYELEVILSMKYEDYFLILADIISWSKNNKIMIGPGRGSASGSLVSYLLNITEIDPIKFELLFERFLNPSRSNMPDIDIDIQDNRRNEVIKYVVDKYGYQYVSQIVTFSILGAKSSLRDSGRFLDIPTREIDELSNLIKIGRSGKTPALDELYENVPAFKSLINKNDRFIKLFNYAKSIEGLPRQTGTHAAGIILSGEVISNIIPIMKTQDGALQSQFSMNYLEKFGLFKIDLLGLRNLTTIKNIQNEIYKNYKRKVNLGKIKFDDRKTNLLFSAADTNGIFQFESAGMKNTLRKIKVSSLDDIVAIIALYRPGPMQFIDEYAARKNKLRVIDYLDPCLEKILKSTYGIIIFQEQIMQIVQVYAGMSLAQADIFRRAISKKKSLKLIQQKDIFIKMSQNNKKDMDNIMKMWSLIFKFANYGFAKSHAVAYSVISYWMGFLKARFPIEFYTQILNSSITSDFNTQMYINELKAKEILINGPSINLSNEYYDNRNRKIYMPLLTIKGLGRVMNSKIINERETYGEYKSFIDFIVRSKKNGVSNSILEILIKTNAVSEFGNVNSLLLSLAPSLRFADMVIIKKDDKVIIDDSIISKPLLIKVARNIKEEVQFQKYYLGFSLNVFSTDIYKYKVRLKDINEINAISVIAQIKRVSKTKTKKEQKDMAFVKIFDNTRSIEVTIMPNVFKFYPNMKKDEIYLFNIIISQYKSEIKYNVIRMKKADKDDER